jgi:F-type H+-transporting ATPase subunit alpha
LNRGRRLTEILKQPQFAPLSFDKQIMIIYAGNSGVLDDVQVEDIRAFEDGLYKFLDANHAALMTDIQGKKGLDDDLKKRMNEALKQYKGDFLATHERVGEKKAKQEEPAGAKA